MRATAAASRDAHLLFSQRRIDLAMRTGGEDLHAASQWRLELSARHCCSQPTGSRRRTDSTPCRCRAPNTSDDSPALARLSQERSGSNHHSDPVEFPYWFGCALVALRKGPDLGFRS